MLVAIVELTNGQDRAKTGEYRQGIPLAVLAEAASDDGQQYLGCATSEMPVRIIPVLFHSVQLCRELRSQIYKKWLVENIKYRGQISERSSRHKYFFPLTGGCSERSRCVLIFLYTSALLLVL